MKSTSGILHIKPNPPSATALILCNILTGTLVNSWDCGSLAMRGGGSKMYTGEHLEPCWVRKWVNEVMLQSKLWGPSHFLLVVHIVVVLGAYISTI